MARGWRVAAIALGVGVLALGVGALVFRDEIGRLRFALSMFSGAEQVERFRSIREIFPVRTITRSPHPRPLPSGPPLALPDAYSFGGEKRDLAAFLAETDTTGLLVLKDDAVVYEAYFRGGSASTQTISWSVAKSLVSALVGIAVGEGRIGSIEQPVTDYVPSLAGSAYDGVRIKDVLQMSSGASWNEDYSDPSSDINRFGRLFAIGGSLDAFAATLEREYEPGTYNRYNSTDTHVLGMLLARTTGRTLSAYLQEKIWHPVGMEADAYWMLDAEGVEFAAGGLNAVLRDYARFGQLFLHEGRVGDLQVVPEAWVRASVVPDAPHLMPGENPQSDFPLGYGYQWWLLDSDEGEYSAIGIYNQFIYVNPSRNLVIAKTSAYSDYGSSDDEAGFRELETFAAFRAIARAAWPEERAGGHTP